ncbi:MAG TPA: hypothetical protein VKF81_03985 [Blastocatellia bacterium]|nr:hypothetical protein [Blastocatellia bacterium]
MAKPKRRFLRLLLIVIAIVVTAIALAPLFPLSPLKSEVEVRLSEMLGRKVTIDSVQLTLITGPSLKVSGMTAQEDAAFGGGVFLKANEARAELDLVQYVRTRRLAIKALTFQSPQINLVKNPNGVWSWTSLGKQSPVSTVSKVTRMAIAAFLGGSISTVTLNQLRVENASVKLIDRTGAGPAEVLYKHIELNALMAPPGQIKGELAAQSNEDGEADVLKAALPFDLRIEGNSPFTISGTVGPGPVQTRNLSVGDLSINGQLHTDPNSPLAGVGQISITQMFIPTVNLSENVASALKVDQIGDMNPGTRIASLQTDFQISRSTFNTSGLQIQDLDGLGDATADNGSFQIQSALTVNYAATINLSPEATARIKSISPVLGLLVTVLESNNRISVPLNIKGDIRRPEIQVDVSRIF